jgi:hypothetical protein
MRIRFVLFVGFLTVLLLVGASNVQAQEFAWARQLGGNGVDEGNGVAVDGRGNVLTVGDFEGTVDFDPGPGVFNLASAGVLDAFVSKLDAAGNLLWARRLGGASSDSANAVAVDSTGGILTLGTFVGTVDFDPGPGVFDLTAPGEWGVFISKLDADGNFVWAKQLSGATGALRASGIAVDSGGNVVTLTSFATPGTIDADPGPGTFFLSDTGGQVLVSKLDSDGNFVWAGQVAGSLWIDGTPGAEASGVAVDAGGNVLATGVFLQTADFDPGPGTFTLTPAGSYDGFLLKLDAGGSLLWVRQLGGLGEDWASGVAVDGDGNVYSVGYFERTVDFDPGPDTFELNSALGTHFNLKLDPDGSFVRANQQQGSCGFGACGIAVNAAGDVATVDLAGVTAFDAGGSLRWQGGFEGGLIVITSGVALDPHGNLTIVGWFAGTVDFNPGPGTNALTANNTDAFLVTLHADGDGDGIPDDSDACPSSVLAATVVIGTCDSGVANTLSSNGCRIADSLDACEEAPGNHGWSVSCMIRVLNQLKEDGVISGSEKGRIQRCAAQRTPKG